MAAWVVVDDDSTLLSVSVLEVAFHDDGRTGGRAGDGDIDRSNSGGQSAATGVDTYRRAVGLLPALLCYSRLDVTLP